MSIHQKDDRVTPWAELHCHTEFSFLDGASAADELVERAAQLGLTALAVTDHQGLYGAVRFAAAAEAAGIRPIVGVEIELLDAADPDPDGIVVPRRGARRRGSQGSRSAGKHPVEHPAEHPAGRLFHETMPAVSREVARGGVPARPRAERARLPGHRDALREDYRGVGERARGPHLVLLARDAAGYRSLCRMVSAGNLAGTKGVPRFTQALLADHVEGIIALSGCRHSEVVRRLLAGDREGAARVAERYARLFGGVHGLGGFFLELQHHLLPDDDWLVAETVRLADHLGLPVVVTNDTHYALPGDRELQDVMVAIRHGGTLDETAHLRRPNGEYHLKSADDLLALPPNDPESDQRVRRAWTEGIATAAELAEGCGIDLGFERYRFPGFAVPKGETPFSRLAELCQEGARRRYHPVTPRVLSQLAHELEVVERTSLAEFFLICWDLMRFARERGIPAQGRGSAGDSIVAYVLGITRVDPIRHNLLFERFINEGRTTYPDVDIDFASSRREEVIQYVYERYGAEHTGMVCNLVTYRARSAVREVGYALGFPRPLVDRVAKALETYDSVMVRRDLEADGGFAEFFAPGPDAGVGASGDEKEVLPRSTRRTGPQGPTEDVGPMVTRSLADVEPPGQDPPQLPPAPETRDVAALLARASGFVDEMGQLNHARRGRWEPNTGGRAVVPATTSTARAGRRDERTCDGPKPGRDPH
jgi:error-prone DNA polymerase